MPPAEPEPAAEGDRAKAEKDLPAAAATAPPAAAGPVEEPEPAAGLDPEGIPANGGSDLPGPKQATDEAAEPDPEGVPSNDGRDLPGAKRDAEAVAAAVAAAAAKERAKGNTNTAMVGVDMTRDGKAIEKYLGLDEPAPAGKLSSTQRTAKQKKKMQRGLLREATASAVTMQQLGAVARNQKPIALTAPGARARAVVSMLVCESLARISAT